MTYSGGRPGDCGPDSASAQVDSQPSVDTLLDILADARRRFLLAFLREQPDGACSFDAATEHVVAQAPREQCEQPAPDEVEHQLHHRHLPKLSKAGLVEYDTRSETIRYRPDERLEALVDHVATLQQE